ncbi:cell division protein FtsK [Parapusillimonas sp. JC17]|uniref:cell division protein FtsK n=1 Tax=Parapusillimonas sp. JC17 TaxID=3445768 RepID=UPI003FA053D3
MKNEQTAPDPRSMTAQTIGKDLLSALVTELKLLPDVWVKISQSKQDDIIDRLRDRVENNIKMAVHLIASDGRTVIQGDLDQVVIKDGAKATIKIGRGAESLLEPYEAQGKAVLIVVAGQQQYTGGMNEVRGETDQRGLNLGKEYTDEDGADMPGEIVDAEIKELPPPKKPTKKELKQAFDDGYQAYVDERPQSDCPVMDGQLCIEWVKGWKAAQDEDEQPENAEHEETEQ